MQRITADDPFAQTANLVAANLEQLKVLFPEAVTDGKIDFEVLKQLLGDAVETSDERYGLQWHGKRRALELALTPGTGALRPCPEESLDWDATQNLMIEGDNLEVLKLLQKSYAGKVKLIYIDPPYNTGNDFVYPDNFQDSVQAYQKLTGQIDSNGRKVSSDPETRGRFHTNWLNMMYPRLHLARKLLAPEGVMFVSIDESEAHNLRALMDQVFGEENLINVISVKTKESSGASGGGEDRKLKKNVETLLLYCRDLDSFSRTDVFRREFLSDLIAEKKAAGKSYEYRQVLTKLGAAEFVASIPDGSGAEIKVFRRVGFEIVPIDKLARAERITVDEAYVRHHAKIFRTTNAQTSIRTRVHELLGDHDGLYSIEYVPRTGRDRGKLVSRFFFGPNTDLVVWLADTSLVEEGRVVKLHKAGTLWDDLAWTGVAKEGGVEFGRGKKPVAFVKRMLSMCMSDDPAGIVLDFFAGSGTTGHAVWEKNLEDNARRRFILVQLPEPLVEANREQRDAIALCDDLGKPRRITELTKERLRRTAQKLRGAQAAVSADLGFRVFQLDTSNISGWSEGPASAQGDCDEFAVLHELALRFGFDLCTPIEQKNIANMQVYSIGVGKLMVCLAEKITRADAEGLALGMAEWHETIKPAGKTTAVFRESAFPDDVAKTKLTSILRQHGMGSVRSL